ncbi:MAG: type IV pilus inner membrane component PilO [Planctomycetota bacterium]
MSSSMRKMILFGLLIVVSYIAYRYMIKPANQHLSEQRTRVQGKLNKLEELEKATVAAKDLSKQLDQLEEALKFFESKLPPTEEIERVLQDVTLIGEKQGVKRKSIRRMSTKESYNGYIEQPLELELEGNFNSFYSFLLELEKLPRIMKVREMKLNKQTDEEGQISADFVVSIFFQDKRS